MVQRMLPSFICVFTCPGASRLICLRLKKDIFMYKNYEIDLNILYLILFNNNVMM